MQLPQSRSVTVYAGPPPTLASHRCWIMTGVDSNRWPGVLRESMLLGNDKKAKFNASRPEDGEPSHLPELHEEREQKEAVFRRILATGRECAVVTRALFNENGEECGESRFAASALDGRGERCWRVAGSALYPAERSMPDGGGLWFPQAEVVCTPVSRGRPEAQPVGRAAPSELPRIRVSDIDRWNVCPYMYWCERVLGLESGRPSLYDSRKAGTLAHLAWEAAFREKEENPKLSIHRYVMDNWASFKTFRSSTPTRGSRATKNGCAVRCSTWRRLRTSSRNASPPSRSLRLRRRSGSTALNSRARSSRGRRTG